MANKDRILPIDNARSRKKVIRQSAGRPRLPWICSTPGYPDPRSVFPGRRKQPLCGNSTFYFVILVLDSRLLYLLYSPGLMDARGGRGTRFFSLRGTCSAQSSCCTVGGTATPAAWNTRPAVPDISLRSTITIDPADSFSSMQ